MPVLVSRSLVSLAGLNCFVCFNGTQLFQKTKGTFLPALLGLIPISLVEHLYPQSAQGNLYELNKYGTLLEMEQEAERYKAHHQYPPAKVEPRVAVEFRV